MNNYLKIPIVSILIILSTGLFSQMNINGCYEMTNNPKSVIRK